jgi:hypothetical protein
MQELRLFLLINLMEKLKDKPLSKHYKLINLIINQFKNKMTPTTNK